MSHYYIKIKINTVKKKQLNDSAKIIRTNVRIARLKKMSNIESSNAHGGL